MPLTTLQKHAVHRILTYVRRENLAAGSHLTESHLVDVVGTSRSPVQAALTHLAKLGVVRHDLNRGSFLVVPASSLLNIAEEWSTAGDDRIYLKIAVHRLNRKIPDVVTEMDLMRIYRTSRNAIRKALSRMQQEGWVERRAGHGWFFLPMIDSVEAYDESYAFRIAIEPAGLLSPTFKCNPAALESCRKEQQHIVAGGYRTMTPGELFEANSNLHETIASWSGNRFILHSVRRMNQLRRLVEYAQAEKRPPRKTQAQEHLAILDEITAGDFLSAATLMRKHLDGARRSKRLSQGPSTPS
jgi:DNA-binding GntR family transcriptional regulator